MKLSCIKLFLLILLISCSTIQSTNQDSKIIQICKFENRPDIKRSSLTNIIERAELKYSTSKDRKKDPEGYIQSLNEIIEKGGYDFLLSCVSNWKKKLGHTFKVSFYDIKEKPKKVMHVEGNKNLKLWVDLYSSFQRVLFTYAHELLHVCQENKSNQLYEAYSKSKNRDDLEKFNRFVFQKEIEAFILMIQMYEKLIKHSNSLCLERVNNVNSNNSKFYEMYASGKEEMKSGVLAQRVINWYQNSFKDNLVGIFKTESKEVKYPRSKLGPEFKLKCLSNEFVKDLKGIGVKVLEPNCYKD